MILKDNNRLVSMKQVYDVLKKNNLILRASKNGWNENFFCKIQTKIDCITNQDMFIAYKGVHFDPHSKMDSITEKKPKCIILENTEVSPPESIPWLLVTNSRKAWSYIYAVAYGNPQEKLKCIGITGTNGKSSTVWMLRQIFKSQNIPTLAIGTLSNWLGDFSFPTEMTTPDPPELFQLLSLAVENKISYVFMEVSSHALALQKVAPIKFTSVAWTSFSRDHTDFHSNMNNYWLSKFELFQSHCKKDAKKYIHDSVKPDPVDFSKNKTGFIKYGVSYDPAGRLDESHAIISSQKDGSSTLSIVLDSEKVVGKTDFVSQFLLENLTLAFLIARDLEPKISTVDLEKIEPVPGRMEYIDLKGGPRLIVDFAHSPDGLEKALLECRKLPHNKLWVIFGCGGDRDSSKRPLMGKIASLKADHVILTSDNPRSENMISIIEEIRLGIVEGTNYEIIPDRTSAIAFALQKTCPQDVVLVAGKGHENYQIVGNKKFDHDDREISRKTWKKIKGI